MSRLQTAKGRAHARRVGQKWPPAEAGAQMRAGRRAAGHKNAEPVGRLRRDTGWAYAALDFFAAFAGGFGMACLVVLALSLAANSCLTLAVMAFTSTL